MIAINSLWYWLLFFWVDKNICHLHIQANACFTSICFGYFFEIHIVMIWCRICSILLCPYAFDHRICWGNWWQFHSYVLMSCHVLNALIISINGSFTVVFANTIPSVWFGESQWIQQWAHFRASITLLA